MPFPKWITEFLAHLADTTSNRNTAKFLMVFDMESSVRDKVAALAEDEHALILACLLGESTALRLYHNFVNFGGRRTCPEAKLAVLEGLGPLATPFLLSVLDLDLASCQYPEPATLEATMTAAEFCEANAGRQLNFCNENFVLYLPWMARAILNQSSCHPTVIAQVFKDAHSVFRASLET